MDSVDVEKGVENQGLELDDASSGGFSLEDEKQNGKIQREPSKHARFKIINHSQSAPDLVDQVMQSEMQEGENGVANGEGSGEGHLEQTESLAAAPSGNMKRRNESESHHGTHHSTQGFATIGYSSTEAVPMTVFYRNENSLSNVCKQRPTLHELHKGKDTKRHKVSSMKINTWIFYLDSRFPVDSEQLKNYHCMWLS